MDRYRGHYLYEHSETIEAEQSLRAILTGQPATMIARSPFGVFKIIGLNVGTKRRMDIQLDWLKCVCFSETPLRELKSFYAATQNPKNWSLKTNRYQKFGLAFEADILRNKGGHPIFYYDRRQAGIAASIEKLGEPSLHMVTRPLLPLCEFYGPKIGDSSKEIDFRWEREWRVTGDLTFALSDIAFGICPEEKISTFEKMVGKTFPFIDPDWEVDQLKQDLESRGWKHLAAKI